MDTALAFFVSDDDDDDCCVLLFSLVLYLPSTISSSLLLLFPVLFNDDGRSNGSLDLGTKQGVITTPSSSRTYRPMLIDTSSYSAWMITPDRMTDRPFVMRFLGPWIMAEREM